MKKKKNHTELKLKGHNFKNNEQNNNPSENVLKKMVENF